MARRKDTRTFGAKGNQTRTDTGGKARTNGRGGGLFCDGLALEPRVLFDGAGALTSAAAFDAAHDAAHDLAAPGDGPDGADHDALLDALTHAAAAEQPGGGRTEIAFIDSAVEDPQDIISALGPNVEVIMLDGGSDGVEQMASALEGRSGVDAIHIFSHGRSGTLDLGNTRLTAASMAGRHGDDMATIGAAMSEDGDILIYGCDFGKGARGAQAMETLAGLTGADVAASDDLTGAASRGGDWELERRFGLIEATTIMARDYDGVLAPVVISAANNSLSVVDANGNPVAGNNGRYQVGVGYVGTWANAGTVGGQLVDVKATVVSIGPGDTFYLEDPSVIGQDDLSVLLFSEGTNSPAEAKVHWELVLAGTNIPATGDIDFIVSDIDGIGGNPYTRETVVPDLQHLTYYGHEAPTNVVFNVTGGVVEATGTQNQNGETTSAAVFGWSNVSSWDITYRLEANNLTSGARSTHDGDGDMAFTNQQNHYLLSLDNDGDDSTAPGTGYQATYAEGGAGVPVVDSDVDIYQHAALGANLDEAVVKLTNAQAGDVLNVGALPAGIAASVDTSVAGEITVTLSGSATVADYEAALQAITFSSSSDTPDVTDRTVDITVRNGTYGTYSNMAQSTIHVLEVNDPPSGADKTIAAQEDTPVALTAADFGFSDVDGDNLQAVIITTVPDATEGALSLNGTPVSAGQTVAAADLASLVFTPAANVNGNGVGAFTFQVVDDGGVANGGQDTDGSPNTMDFDIAPVNDPPVAANDTTAVVVPGQTVNVNPLVNDSDVDNDPLTITQIVDPANPGSPIAIAPGTTVVLASGTQIVMKADGSLDVTPARINADADLFDYVISDGNGGTAQATVTVPLDRDGDGISDAIDIDDDNDGVLDVNEGGGDTDGDGIADKYDLDSDNDGISDLMESGAPAALVALDVNHDGTLSAAETQAATGAGLSDVDNDGLMDVFDSDTTSSGTAASVGTAAVDSDADGVNDLLDLDSDNDGIPDTVEARPTAAYVANDGDVTDNDADGDGVIDLFDANDGGTGDFGGSFAGPEDTDGDGTPDYLDDNSDNDAYADTAESGLAPGADGNGDGIGDGVNASYADPDGDVNDPSSDLANQFNDTSQVGYREVNTPPSLTNDGDGSSGAPAGDYEATYTENDAAIHIVDAADAAVSDAEDNIVGLVVTLTDGKAGDSIQFPSSLPGGITASVAPGTTLGADGVLSVTFTGTAATTNADWDSVLRALTFLPSTGNAENPDPADRHFTLQVEDSEGAQSNITNATIHVVPVNDPPALDLDDDDSSGINGGNYHGVFTEDGGPVPIHSNMLLTDLDDTSLESATVTLTNPKAGDELTISGTPVQAGDSGTINGIAYAVTAGANGEPVITLSGPAGIADYDAALESIGFNNTDQNPDTTQRDISVIISDGDDTSALRHAYIDVVEVNDPPTVSTPLADQASTDGNTSFTMDAAASFADVDGVNTYALGAGAPSWLQIDPATGEISINGAIPHDASQNSNITGGAPGTYDVTVIATDDDGASVSDTFRIAISNPAPVAVDDASAADEDTTQTGNVLTDASTGDADGGPDSDALTVSAVSGASLGQPQSLTHGDLTLNADGSWTFVPNAAANALAQGESAQEQVTYTITDGEGGTDSATLTITINGTNDAPVVVDPGNPGAPVGDPANVLADVVTADSATPASVDASAAFADADGSDTLSYSATGLPAGLSIDAATGVISGTIDHSASQGGDDPVNNPGVYTVVVTATDPHGASAETTITYTVSNPAPVAEDDALTTDEDTVLSDTVFAAHGNGADSDPDGDAFTVSQVAGAAGNVGQAVAGSNGGSFTINADGTVSFDPGQDFQDLAVGETRDTTVSYEISDGEGGVDSATVTVTVSGVNDAPVVVDPGNPGAPVGDPANVLADVVTADSATPASVDASAAFADADGSDTLSYSATGLPAGLSIDAATGVISGTIDHSASQGGDDPVNNPGVYTVVVTATDPHGASAETTITYTVSNPAPVAVDDTGVTDEDTPVSGDVLGNDHDTGPDSDVLQVAEVAGDAAHLGQPVAGSAGGEFIINPDGSWSFDPGADFQSLGDGESRETTIAYQVSDGQGGLDTATLTVTVTGVNDAPLVAPPLIQREVTDGETIAPVETAGAFNNGNGDPLTFTATGLPDGLSIDPNTGEISGTIDPDASLGGSYNAVVTATAANGGTASVGVAFTVHNAAPQAADDAVQTAPETAVVVNVVANDADGAPDSDALGVTGTTAPAHGAVVINPDGTVSYTPNAGFAGVDSFDYTISDGQGGTATATVTVTVTAPAQTVPGVPTATPLPAQQVLDGETIQPIDVSGAFTDPDGQPLSYAASGLPAGLSIDPATGQITGTVDPDASEDGPYVVQVTASDPDGNQVTEPLIITVGNPVPQANDDAASTPQDTPVTLVVLGNDSDADGDPLHVAMITTPPAHGTVVINPDGTVTYTPDSGYAGPDSFSYIAEDANGGRDEAQVSISVGAPVPGVPVASGALPDQALTDGAPMTPLDVSAGFADPDGQPLTFAATGLPAGVSIDAATGVISGTPVNDASASGPYVAQVTASDPDGNQVSAPLVITVANPGPAAVDDMAVTPVDTPVQIGVLGNDGDPDGDPLTVSIVAPPAHGSVSVNPDGTVTYVPDAGFSGSDAFSYQIADGQGGVDTAVAAITVGGNGGGLSPQPAVPPVDAEDSSTPAPLDISQYLVDPEGDPLTFTASGLPAGLSIDPATGVISGTLDHSASQGGPNGDGVHVITVRGDDGHGGVTTANVTYRVTNVAPQNISPIPDEVALNGHDVSIETASHFADADGDTLTYAATGLPAGLSIDPASGQISGTLALDASRNGPYAITVTADDGEGGLASHTFELEVNAANERTPENFGSGTGAQPRPDAQRGAANDDGQAGLAPDEPPLTDAVNGLEDLGGSALPDNLVILESVNGILSLDGLAGRFSDGVIRDIAEWMGRTDARGWASSLREGGSGADHFTYNGSNLSMPLGLSGAGEMRLRTLVTGDGALVIDLGARGADRADVLMDQVRVFSADGRPLPWHVSRAGARTVIVDVPAGQEWMALRIEHRADGNAVEQWDVRINLQTGEIVQQAHAGGGASVLEFLDQVEHLAGSERGEADALLRALAG